jgi:putative methionine-R-sulfoxide reductase with GAF domain
MSNRPELTDHLLALAEAVVGADDLDTCAQAALPTVAHILNAPSALLYVSGQHFYSHGIAPDAVAAAQALCATVHSQLGGAAEAGPVTPTPTDTPFTLYHLGQGHLIGWPTPTPLPDRLPGLLATAITRLLERAKLQRQLTHLNTYQTVSSMLTQSLGLDEMMETTLYCCMEMVSAEAASILLLDDDKQNFFFYQVEGPAKPVLMAARMPADKGLAGAILQSQQPEVINDAQNDPRFYQTFDSQSSFQTHNMIAIPLTAGKEKIGVLEVLNKVEGGNFTTEEQLMLMTIAEEIAFAVRNARIFEYVVKSYCKQRQGQMSCKGCERPLGSWTPCVKYQETGTWRIVTP